MESGKRMSKPIHAYISLAPRADIYTVHPYITIQSQLLSGLPTSKYCHHVNLKVRFPHEL